MDLASLQHDVHYQASDHDLADPSQQYLPDPAKTSSVPCLRVGTPCLRIQPLPLESSAPSPNRRSTSHSPAHVSCTCRTILSNDEPKDDGVEHLVGNTLPAPLRELTNKMARVPLHQTTIMSSPPRSQWTTHPWSSACTHSMREVIPCCAANTQARGLRGRGRAHLRTATAVGFGTELSC